MAAGGELTYVDYLKAALARRARVPLLGKLPVNYLAIATFAVLGIANPGFWLLGAAAEASYLVFMAGSKRFRKLLEGERLLAAQHTHETRVQESLSRLAAESQHRYRRLLGHCREILGISKALDSDNLESLERTRTGGLNQLLSIFLRLLTSREVLVDTMSRTDRQGVEGEIGELESRIEQTPEEGSLSRSLKGSLEIQHKRLENLDRAESNLAVLDAELGRIEHQVALILEETAVSGRAEILSERLDMVTGALKETNRWMERHAEIFGGIDGTLEGGGELPDLGPPPVPTKARQAAE